MIHEELILRERDSLQEEREQRRYEILKGVYERGWPDTGKPVRALDIGLKVGMSREELFRAVLDLTQRSYLSFCAAGPQVRITERGVAFLKKVAGRRRSIRDL